MLLIGAATALGVLVLLSSTSTGGAAAGLSPASAVTPSTVAAAAPIARSPVTTAVTTAAAAPTGTGNASSAGAPLRTTRAGTTATRPPAAAIPAGGGDATVGPLFPDGVDGPHVCTASVVASTTGNLLITAAHCVTGTGADVVFAPGYHDGAASHGTWVVQRAYADARWLRSQDPSADYAFLAVAPADPEAGNDPSKSVQAVVGGVALGDEPRNTQSVVVTGYPAGTGGQQMRCLAAVEVDPAIGGVPTFACGGFVPGTSGGPWVAAASGERTVVGVIGGPHLGGCRADESFTAPFDSATRALFERAEANEAEGAHNAGAKGDVLPAPGGDDC